MSDLPGFVTTMSEGANLATAALALRDATSVEDAVELLEIIVDAVKIGELEGIRNFLAYMSKVTDEG